MMKLIDQVGCQHMEPMKSWRWRDFVYRRSVQLIVGWRRPRSSMAAAYRPECLTRPARRFVAIVLSDVKEVAQMPKTAWT